MTLPTAMWHDITHSRLENTRSKLLFPLFLSASAWRALHTTRSFPKRQSGGWRPKCCLGQTSGLTIAPFAWSMKSNFSSHIADEGDMANGTSWVPRLTSSVGSGLKGFGFHGGLRQSWHFVTITDTGEGKPPLSGLRDGHYQLSSACIVSSNKFARFTDWNSDNRHNNSFCLRLSSSCVGVTVISHTHVLCRGHKGLFFISKTFIREFKTML